MVLNQAFQWRHTVQSRRVPSTGIANRLGSDHKLTEPLGVRENPYQRFVYSLSIIVTTFTRNTVKTRKGCFRVVAHTHKNKAWPLRLTQKVWFDRKRVVLQVGEVEIVRAKK